MQLIDLFSGIGGFALAAHSLGWQTLAYCEKDEFCRKVLRKNFGKDIEICDDIFNFDGKKYRNSADIVCGGFPCQPFSTAGSQKGEDDERHLFPQMLRVISEARPTWVVAENVHGILSISNGSTFENIAASLESLGYEVITFCIPVSALNAPHRRDRIFIIAHADDQRRERRREQFETAERQIHSGCRDYRTFGKPEIRESRISGTYPDTAHQKPETLQKGEGIGEWNGVGRISRNSSNADRARELQPKRGERTFRRWIGDRVKSISSDSDSCGLEKQCQPQPIKSKIAGDNFCAFTEIIRNGWRESWREAALRTCVLPVDDGLSRRLVRPRGWRNNAIKAAGNSVSPILIYEIFKVIKMVEENL